LKSKRQEDFRVKLKRKVEADQQKNRELKIQLEALMVEDSDGDISD
jgi:hypothetical protein